MVVPWYEDRFFYFGCSLVASARIFTNFMVGKPYSYRFYKWLYTMPIGGLTFHFLNRRRLKNIKKKLDKVEAQKIFTRIGPLGAKEGKQIDEHEDELKELIKRINH